MCAVNLNMFRLQMVRGTPDRQNTDQIDSKHSVLLSSIMLHFFFVRRYKRSLVINIHAMLIRFCNISFLLLKYSVPLKLTKSRIYCVIFFLFFKFNSKRFKNMLIWNLTNADSVTKFRARTRESREHFQFEITTV